MPAGYRVVLSGSSVAFRESTGLLLFALLMGIVKENSIILVDDAVRLQDQGMDALAAIQRVAPACPPGSRWPRAGAFYNARACAPGR